MATELDALKQRQADVFTKKIVEELELMRQHVILHEQAINKMMRQALEASTGAAHFQTVADSLGVAMSV